MLAREQVNGFEAFLLTSTSGFLLCFAIIMGIKLRWFRARINLRESVPSASYGAISGTYRPRYRDIESGGSNLNRHHNVTNSRDVGEAGQNLSRNHTTRNTIQNPHHKSMPNLAPVSNHHANTLGRASKPVNNSVVRPGKGKAPAPKPPQHNTSNNKPQPTNTTMNSTVSKNVSQKAPAVKAPSSKPPAPKMPTISKEENLASISFEKIKLKRNGTIASSDAESELAKFKRSQTLTSSNEYLEETQTVRKNDYIQAARGIPFFEPDSEEDDYVEEEDDVDLDFGNLSFVTQNGRPLSFTDNVPIHNTRVKLNNPPLTPSAQNFLDYEEFET